MKTVILNCDICKAEADELLEMMLGPVNRYRSRAETQSELFKGLYVKDKKKEVCASCLKKLGLGIECEVRDAPDQSFVEKLIAILNDEPEIIEWLGQFSNNQ